MGFGVEMPEPEQSEDAAASLAKAVDARTEAEPDDVHDADVVDEPKPESERSDEDVRAEVLGIAAQHQSANGAEADPWAGIDVAGPGSGS